MTDREVVLTRLGGLIGGDSDRAFVVIHNGVPIPKSRARFGGAAVYTPTRTRDAQTALAWSFKAHLKGRGPARGSLAIIAMFYRPDRRRLDADNLMKLVMDAATKAGVWHDDSQVTAQAALIELDKTHPRTVVAICPYTSTMNPSGQRSLYGETQRQESDKRIRATDEESGRSRGRQACRRTASSRQRHSEQW